jgi:hypothetical protein
MFATIGGVPVSNAAHDGQHRIGLRPSVVVNNAV